MSMRFSKSAAICIGLALSLNAQAATVFNVAGIENIAWLELTATVGKSRLQVESLLASDAALDGWRYATRSEVESLYDSLWGGTVDGYSADNFAGARTFVDAFGVHNFFGANGYDEYGSTSWATLFGSSMECGADIDSSCQGLVALYDMNYGSLINAGYFHDDYGLSTGTDGINNQLTITSLFGYPYLGSHLVKDLAVVPLPAAVWLFGTGLAVMAAMAKRKQK